MKLLIIGAAFLAVACGADEPTNEAAAPDDPPPTVRAESAPPPAWIESRGGDSWLAFGSFCWERTCADARPPEMRTDLPQLSLEPGETVRFHLDFEPSRLELHLGERMYTLEPDRTAEWRVEGDGGIMILRTSSEGRSVDYIARMNI